jgi:hypothetical protein
MLSRNIEYSEAPSLLRQRLEICLDENLNRFFARIDLDANRRIAEIYLVSATVVSSDNGVRHMISRPGFE